MNKLDKFDEQANFHKMEYDFDNSDDKNGLITFVDAMSPTHSITSIDCLDIYNCDLNSDTLADNFDSKYELELDEYANSDDSDDSENYIDYHVSFFANEDKMKKNNYLTLDKLNLFKND